MSNTQTNGIQSPSQLQYSIADAHYPMRWTYEALSADSALQIPAETILLHQKILLGRYSAESQNHAYKEQQSADSPARFDSPCDAIGDLLKIFLCCVGSVMSIVTSHVYVVMAKQKWSAGSPRHCWTDECRQ